MEESKITKADDRELNKMKKGAGNVDQTEKRIAEKNYNIPMKYLNARVLNQKIMLSRNISEEWEKDCKNIDGK